MYAATPAAYYPPGVGAQDAGMPLRRDPYESPAQYFYRVCTDLEDTYTELEEAIDMRGHSPLPPLVGSVDGLRLGDGEDEDDWEERVLEVYTQAKEQAAAFLAEVEKVDGGMDSALQAVKASAVSVPDRIVRACMETPLGDINTPFKQECSRLLLSYEERMQMNASAMPEEFADATSLTLKERDQRRHMRLSYQKGVMHAAQKRANHLIANYLALEDVRLHTQKVCRSPYESDTEYATRAVRALQISVNDVLAGYHNHRRDAFLSYLLENRVSWGGGSASLAPPAEDFLTYLETINLRLDTRKHAGGLGGSGGSPLREGPFTNLSNHVAGRIKSPTRSGAAGFDPAGSPSGSFAGSEAGSVPRPRAAAGGGVHSILRRRHDELIERSRVVYVDVAGGKGDAPGTGAGGDWIDGVLVADGKEATTSNRMSYWLDVAKDMLRDGASTDGTGGLLPPSAAGPAGDAGNAAPALRQHVVQPVHVSQLYGTAEAFLCKHDLEGTHTAQSLVEQFTAEHPLDPIVFEPPAGDERPAHGAPLALGSAALTDLDPNTTRRAAPKGREAVMAKARALSEKTLELFERFLERRLVTAPHHDGMDPASPPADRGLSPRRPRPTHAAVTSVPWEDKGDAVPPRQHFENLAVPPALADALERSGLDSVRRQHLASEPYLSPGGDTFPPTSHPRSLPQHQPLPPPMRDPAAVGAGDIFDREASVASLPYRSWRGETPVPLTTALPSYAMSLRTASAPAGDDAVWEHQSAQRAASTRRTLPAGLTVAAAGTAVAPATMSLSAAAAASDATLVPRGTAQHKVSFDGEPPGAGLALRRSQQLLPAHADAAAALRNASSSYYYTTSSPLHDGTPWERGNAPAQARPPPLGREDTALERILRSAVAVVPSLHTLVVAQRAQAAGPRPPTSPIGSHRLACEKNCGHEAVFLCLDCGGCSFCPNCWETQHDEVASGTPHGKRKSHHRRLITPYMCFQCGAAALVECRECKIMCCKSCWDVCHEGIVGHEALSLQAGNHLGKPDLREASPPRPATGGDVTKLWLSRSQHTIRRVQNTVDRREAALFEARARTAKPGTDPAELTRRRPIFPQAMTATTAEARGEAGPNMLSPFTLSPPRPAGAGSGGVPDPTDVQRLLAVYKTHAPHKLHLVMDDLRRHSGREDELFRELEEQYGPPPASGASHGGGSEAAPEETPVVA